MKPAFPKIVGNQQLRETLKEEIRKRELSHAYLIEGAAGRGKSLLAMQIAAALSCEHRDEDGFPLPCGECASCRKIFAGNSPDIITVTKEDKATLGVEAIRNLRADICIAPNESDYKIYIIDDAHLMTVQAQNAFLLTLEEPPEYVLFLLLCESVAPLLETVRSRAPTLRLEPIQNEELSDYLCRTVPEADNLYRNAPKELHEVIFAADGSIGKAMALLDAKQRKTILEQRQNARTFLELCLHPNTSETLRFLAGLGQKREDLTAQWNVFLLCLRDLLVCKQSENAPLCFFPDREEALDLSCRFSAPSLLRLCEAVDECIDRFRKNANVRLTLTWFAIHTGLLKRFC